MAGKRGPGALLDRIFDEAIDGTGISKADALALTSVDGSTLMDLFTISTRVRERFFGNKVELCSIINAKSGNCTEDCAYCAQSARHRTEVKVHDLVTSKETTDLATFMESRGSKRFGLVTSGKGVLTGEDFERLLGLVGDVNDVTGMEVCASLGFVNYEQARALKEAGLTRYHHNLETSRTHFPSICSSHDYDGKLDTIRNVKEAGLKVCTGGILGLGESWEQRVELAFEIKGVDPDSVPVNSLVPIKGTRMEGRSPIPPMDLLKALAIFRLVMPSKSISVAAGREQNLRDLRSMIFQAGASGMMIGNFLTITGRKVEDDLQMLVDLGLEHDVMR